MDHHVGGHDDVALVAAGATTCAALDLGRPPTRAVLWGGGVSYDDALDEVDA